MPADARRAARAEWESRDAIKAFAGEDIDAAVVCPEDERYLIGGEFSIAR